MNMKARLIYSVIILASVTAGAVADAAPLIQWNASSGAEGYNLYCGETPVVTPTQTNVGTVVTYDVAALVTAGTESECWVTAYAVGFQESAESNHIRFTPPSAIQTVIVPGQPSSVTISWE